MLHLGPDSPWFGALLFLSFPEKVKGVSQQEPPQPESELSPQRDYLASQEAHLISMRHKAYPKTLAHSLAADAPHA